MTLLLSIIFAALAGYTVSYVTLSSFWSNSRGVIVVSAIFAVLVAIFVPVVGAALLVR